MTTHLIPLAQVTDPSRFGRKATTLARLARAGLPVPDGFVLPVDLTDEQADTMIPHLLSALTPLAPHGVIARSSAICEDGQRASFAGLYTSRFCPTDPASLQRAVHDVRASATSTAAHAYATARNIAYNPAMAVLIQPAMRPFAAGILAAEFGRPPMRWRIEAIRGLAEPLASGAQTGEIHDGEQQIIPAQQTEIVLPATPEELQLPPGEWIDLPLIDRTHERAKIRTSAAGLIHLHPADPRPVLEPPHRTRLLELALVAADVLDLNSVDLEWAMLPDGTVQLLQTRPLTCSLPDPSSADRCVGDREWQGIPASPGQATGPLAHLSDLPEGTIKNHVLLSGNIGADAAAALLQEPAAIITTCGGPLSHAAITARELGIPCVTALPETIAAVPTGTNISVNGLTGRISSIPPSVTRLERADDSTLESSSNFGTAIVVANPASDSGNHDGLPTLLMHHPGHPVIRRILSSPTVGPTGLFQPTETPSFSTLPEGYTDHLIPGLGRLAWPNDLGLLPQQLLVLNGANVLHQRRVTIARPAASGSVKLTADLGFGWSVGGWGEAAFEGDLEGVQGGLPALDPAFL
ncbi:hypothetical protein E1287_27335, partial [Actinomadura sp. KC06]|uniref:PEP/pyruvate-binding domain-containing protein n=1 Tax=Actinomadura sp. KC06 TaxID=2530369 RepID=UPI00104DB75E